MRGSDAHLGLSASALSQTRRRRRWTPPWPKPWLPWAARLGRTLGMAAKQLIAPRLGRFHAAFPGVTLAFAWASASRRRPPDQDVVAYRLFLSATLRGP
jgi:hypothetical protein